MFWLCFHSLFYIISTPLWLKNASFQSKKFQCCNVGHLAQIFGTFFFSVEDAGGKCLPCAVDIQDEEAVYNAVGEAVKKFGGIDILVNNASVINLTGTLETTMKK